MVLQHVDNAGAVVGTWLVRPGEALPPAPWHDPNKPVRVGLRVVALGAGVTAVGLLGAAALTESQHKDPTRTDLSLSDLEGLRDRSRRLTVASGVAGGVAVGCFGLSVSGVFR